MKIIQLFKKEVSQIQMVLSNGISLRHEWFKNVSEEVVIFPVVLVTALGLMVFLF